MIVKAYDVETTGVRRRSSEMFSFSTCTEAGQTSVHRLDGSPLRQVQSNKAFDDLWSDRGTRIVKVGHNMKFDLGFTQKKAGNDLRKHTYHCTMMMSNILQNHHPSHALKDLAWELAGIPKDDEKAIKPYTRGGQSYQNVPEHLFDLYQRRDVERTMLLFQFWYPMIQANKDWLECYEVERDLLRVSLAMEDRGLMLNVPKCKAYVTKLEQDCQTTLDEIESLEGERLVPGTEKCRYYLYEKYKIPQTKKTKTGKPSMEKEHLLELHKQMPHCKLLDLIVRYTSWQHGGRAMAGYLDAVDADDIIHPNIRTCAAITGRQSCADPNLTNVEKEVNLLNPYPTAARTIFRPRPGYVNFHIDYQGQEMRGLVHYSGDPELVKIACEGGNLHFPAAGIFYGNRFTSVMHDKKARKAMYDATKNGNFAIAYGAQFIQVAKTLGLAPLDAARARREYVARFPRLVGLMPTIMAEIKKNGFITTAFGRRLHVPRDLAYVGVNYLIQGTAAEMLKRGQVRVAKYLEEATGGEMRMLLSIHDELIIECPRSMLKYAREILRHVGFLMCDFPGRFRVPFEIEVSVATYDWAHKEEFKL